MDDVEENERLNLENSDLRSTNRSLLAQLDEARAELDETKQYVSDANAQLDAAAKDTADAARRLHEQREHVNFYGNALAHTEMARRKLDEQVEFYRGELAKAQVCADEMAALAWKWKYKADCQRDTTRALVVAARVTRLVAVGFAVMGDWGEASRRVHDEIRFGIKHAKQSGQQERKP